MYSSLVLAGKSWVKYSLSAQLTACRCHLLQTSCTHSNFPVIDTDENGILFGTTGRNALCILLQQRAFGHPHMDTRAEHSDDAINSKYLRVKGDDVKYCPLGSQWDAPSKKSYPKVPFLLLSLQISADEHK